MDYKSLMPRAYGSSVEFLNLTARLCQEAINNNVEGQFGEAGVANGVHGVVMNDVAKGVKEIWMMDSFQGISLHGPEDKEWTEAHGFRNKSDPRTSGGITSHSIRQVANTIYESGQTIDNFKFVKGWFIDTLPKLPDDLKFSVLRLDVDLYSPYMDCFKWLIPKLTIGSYLIIDDWCLSGMQKAMIDSELDASWFTLETHNDYTNAYLKWTWERKIVWEQIVKIKDKWE